MIRQIAAASALFMAMAVHAQVGKSASRIPTVKRQVSDCMTKHMAVSRSLSYNAAITLCKAEVRSQHAAMAAGVPAKPLS